MIAWPLPVNPRQRTGHWRLDVMMFSDVCHDHRGINLLALSMRNRQYIVLPVNDPVANDALGIIALFVA